MTLQRERLRIHFGLVIAELICIPAFIFETYRAVSGNSLSWAYVFEWPLLGLYAIYVWRKLLREESNERLGVATNPPQSELDDETAAQLNAWNDYLNKVHRSEPSAE
jgi:hypothetical protein